MFVAGESYSKKDIYKILQVPPKQQKGKWNTGYTKHGNDFYIFANIDSAGRTGHNYKNHWKGKDLVWSAKTSTNLNQPFIIEMMTTNGNINIFTRNNDRDPFTYQGYGKIKSYEDSTPVKIIWQLNTTDNLDIKEAWFNFLINAKHYLKSAETYYSPKQEYEYKIIKVTNKSVAIEKFNNAKQSTYNLAYNDFESALKKILTAKGTLLLGQMHRETAFEDTIVELTPILDWDETLENIIFDKNKVENK